jgi:hypothetical protein
MPDELLRLLVDSALEHAVFLLDREGLGVPVTEIFTPLDQRSGIAELERAIAGAAAISEDDRWHLRHDGGDRRAG